MFPRIVPPTSADADIAKPNHALSANAACPIVPTRLAVIFISFFLLVSVSSMSHAAGGRTCGLVLRSADVRWRRHGIAAYLPALSMRPRKAAPVAPLVR